MNRRKIRILYIETKEIKLLDIPRALDELGFDVYRAAFRFSAQEYLEEAVSLVKNTITHYEVQYVISYDFSVSIAQGCFLADVPYIAWVYDAPQKELYTPFAFYPTNYIFVFDKLQQKRLWEIGIEKVFHMPLAILENKVRMKLQEAEKGEQNADITLVGQLYKMENNLRAIECAEEEIRSDMEREAQKFFFRWDKNTQFHASLPEICVRYFSQVDQNTVLKKYPYITEQFYYEASVTARLLANRERVTALNRLAEKYRVHFYTRDKDTSQLNEKVRVFPAVHYDNEISQIYHNSKINLNITLHCIESGASQRIFDVMAAGGFLLSNYQPELEEMFVVGEEIVLFHSLQEMEDMAEYYLTHEEERKRIARKGQQKVLRYHDLHDRMEQVMELVMEREEGRDKKYLLQQRDSIWEQADRLLCEGTEEAYNRLESLLNDLRNRTVIMRTTELGTLLEMINCRHIEIQSGDSGLFSDISNVREAEEKHLSIKHLVWRMEAGICEEKAQEKIKKLCEKKESKLLIAWIIKMQVKEWERVFLKVSRYMQEYGITDALELLSYGILICPGNQTLLLEKADCLMEIGMWKEVLDTLCQIKEPDVEVREMIQELTAVLKESVHEGA